MQEDGRVRVEGEGRRSYAQIVRSRLMFVLAVVLGVVVIMSGVLLLNRQTGIVERHVLYFPSGTISVTPSDVGLAYENVELVASDGVEIHGWFVPGENGITWLWFHGNAGNIGHRVGLIQELREATGVSVFIVSYRGYGNSSGSPSERGFYRDAEAAWEHLQERTEIDHSRIVVFGRSIGSGVAVDLAARHAPAALVLETPFRSLRWLARQVYPWLPVGPFIHERYEVEEKAASITAPTLVIHGDRDEIIPISGGRAIAAAMGGEAAFYLVEGARHNDVPVVGGDAYYDQLRAFLASVFGEAALSPHP